MSITEQQIEEQFIEKLMSLKYIHRLDLRDSVPLEQNFRHKFEALNLVWLTDGEFFRLLDEIVTTFLNLGLVFDTSNTEKCKAA